MDLEAQTVFRTLNEFVEDTRNGSSECFRMISSLNYNLTEEQVDHTIIDDYLLYMFDKSNGITHFIKTAGLKKEFKHAVNKCLEFIYTLVNNFPKLFGRYAINVCELCLKINVTSAPFENKIRALDLLSVTLEKVDECLENQEYYLNMFKRIKQWDSLNHPDSVRQKELMVLGVFAKKYSYLITDPNGLKLLFINALDIQNLKKPSDRSQPIICGVFTGLLYFTESFPLSLDDNSDKEIIDKLYKFIRELSLPKGRRKYDSRAAMDFISNNMDTFINHVLKDYKAWHAVLLKKWIYSDGVEEQKTGVSTLRAYFNGVSKALMDIPTNQNNEMLKHYIKRACESLTKESLQEKRLGLYCLKSFSKCCLKHMPTADVNVIFVNLMDDFEKTYILNEDPTNENWQLLPDYVQCVASFMKGDITMNYFVCLQRAVINMIRTFHKLETLHHGFVIDSVIQVLFCLKDTKYFDMFVENVIYQGILWSCSHQHISELDFTDDPRSVVTVKKYFPLWKNILKLQSNRNYDKYGIFLEDRRVILIAVVDNLVNSLFTLINKLDVNIEIKNQEEYVTDIANMYTISKKDDYAIFLNVVDFYQEILNNINETLLERYIIKSINILMEKCIKYPFISGFYKLLSFKLKILNKLKLFSNEHNTNTDVINCKNTLNKFIYMLLHKMLRYKDELLISCLNVLLQTPTVIIQPYLKDCANIFISIFELGKNHIPLADIGLETLENWQQNLTKDEFEPFLIKVIPSLDPYLRSKSLGTLMQASTVEKRRKTDRALKKRKVILELEPELVKFQQKILKFVGSQNGKVCKAFVQSDNNIKSAIVGENLHLKVNLPYDDTNLEIYMEPFLPRIVDLALNCTDRKSRITACELLHSSVILFLGKSKPMTDTGLSELDSLLECISTPLLHLSCDTDQIVQQLFEPLFLQLIHWYASNIQKRSSHSAIIIETIINGVTHSTNSSVRDFSGKCASEYVKWTIKQTGSNRLADDPINIKVLIKKMKFYSLHPDLSKKFGAALLFNNIYRELREEECLVNIFWIEILDIFIQSLDSVENFDYDSQNCSDEIFKALQHWKRVFVTKNRLFLSKYNKRRVPKSIDNNKNNDLVAIAEYLIEKSNSKSKYCRESCTELFETLKSLNKDIKSIKINSEFYEEYIKRFPKLTDIKNNEDCFVLIKWLQNLHCAIDGCIFIVKNNLNKVNEDSHTINSIKYFLEHIQNATFEECLNLICLKTWAYTNIDKKYFYDLKSHCIYSILNLSFVIPNEIFYFKHYFTLLLNIIFNPQELHIEDNNELKYTEIIQKILTKKCPDELKTMINSYVQENINLHFNIMRNIDERRRNFINGLIFFNNFLNLNQFTTGLINKLLLNFYENVENKIIIMNDLPQTTIEFCAKIFKFSLSNKDEIKTLINHFFNGYTVRLSSLEYQKGTHFGIFLISTFKEVLMPCILENFDYFLNHFLKESAGIDYITHILNILSKNKKNNYQHIARSLLENWKDLEKYLEEDWQDGLEFLKLFHLFGETDVAILQWLINLFNCEIIKNNYEYQVEIFVLLNIFTNEDIEKEFIRPFLNDFCSNVSQNPNIKPTLVDKIISTFSLCKSSVFFEFLLNIYTNSNSEMDIIKIISKYVASCNNSLQEMSLKITYDAAISNENQSIKIMNNIFPPLLQNCNISVFEQFYVDNIQNITRNLQENNNNLKIISFVLIELLFSRIPLGSKDRENCPIINASNDPKLNTVFLKHCLETLKGNIDQKILKRKAYKALASILTNSENSKLEPFFEKLFYRAENNIDVLWPGIIDFDISYNFPLYFDTLPKQRKILISVRSELRKQNSENSLKYIESQRILNSTLSEDITRYDFTNSMVRQEPIEQKTDTYLNEIYLDGTEINDNECMPVVCAVIKYIFESGINTLPGEDDDVDELPIWMEGIRKLLVNETTHKNVKIFLVKVIENVEYIFRNYSKFFVGPLLKFISDGCAGDNINYFITDMLVIIASWAKRAVPDECNIKHISSVISFLTTNIDNERQDIFKYNLELIKLMLESWRSNITVPYNNIISKLNYDINNRKIEVGIHLASVFFVNNLPACVDINDFWKKLLKILDSEVKTIYRPCAETIGLFLKYLDENDVDNNFTDDLNNDLSKWSSFELEKYALILEGISIHFPNSINEDHKRRLVCGLGETKGTSRILFLKVINIFAADLCQLDAFKFIDWNLNVKNDNLEIQIISLNIILKSLSALKKYGEEFDNILQSLSILSNSPNILCRSLTYDIFMKLLNENDILLEQNRKNVCKEILIQGLTDSDIENRERIQQFWIDFTEMPTNITCKFCYLLSDLYSPKSEYNFLGYSSYFLLNPLNNEEKDVKLFDNPLEDCTFEEYNMKINWRMRHPSEVPLFAETLRSYQETFNPYTEGSFNNLKATQSLNFTPTQSARQQQISELTNVSSSLLISSVDSADSSFKNPNFFEISVPKRRFLKDKAKMSAQFAHHEVRKQIKKTEKRFEAVKEGERKVSIYRKYRKGDFPDIEIDLSAIVKPLQMLSLFDGEISKTFFTSIFKALNNKVENNYEFLNSVKESITNICTNSTRFSSNLFSTLFDILLKNKSTISFDPQLLSTVSQQSGLISFGALILEEYINLLDPDTPSTSKKGPNVENEETNLWLKLAELYRELEEWDLVRTIFLEKINCKESIQNAITFESEQKWRQAQECYKSLIETDISIERRDFYYESYFKCLANLGEWNNLPDAISSIVPSEDSISSIWEKIWDKEWYQQKLLPWYIISHVRQGLFSNNVSDRFLEELNSSHLKSEENDYLRAKFSEELCILWLFKGDIGQAGQYLKSSLQNFINDWQIINPMFESLRYNKILNLCNVVEMDKFIGIENNINEESDNIVKYLCDNWVETQSEFLPNILLSEARLLYRKTFINLLIEKAIKLDLNEMEKRLRKTKIMLDIAFMNVAIENNNYYMVRKYYKEYEKLNHFSLQLIYGNVAYLRSKVCTEPVDELNTLLRSSEIFGELLSSHKNDTKAIEANLKYFEINQKMSDVLSNNKDIFEDNLSDLREMFGDINTANDIPLKCSKKLRDLLLNDTNFDESMDTDEHNKQKECKDKLMSKALVTLAYFVKDNKNYTGDFITYVLRGMKLNSKEARQLFPCLLLEDKIADEFKELFVRESETIPVWMFLGWIPQLLSIVDTQKIGAVSKIILRIAEMYPQAIMYAYRLSKENYKNLNNIEANDLIQKLDKLLLSDKNIESFLKCMSYVSVPSTDLQHYFKKMCSCNNIQDIMEIRNIVLNDFYSGNPDSKNPESLQGNTFKKISPFEKRIRNLEKLSLDKIKKELIKMNEELKLMKDFSHLLQDYSPKLYNFSFNKNDSEIEIPGQYTGDKMPLIHHHIKISGFLPNVKIMSSLRRPIKITIIGSNTKEYPFLIKFGEDVRQDQRIQQIFTLMNNVFAADNQNFEILTYQVIPLTNSLGMIQWIDPTTPLNSFIKKSLKDKRSEAKFDSLVAKYDSFLSNGKGDFHRYGMTAVKKDRNKLIPFFQELVNSVPMDILKKSFWTLATTTEDFIALRSNFIKSYSVICACHYIVGIGDRHLSNSLICTKNGKVLGIDFGHAFGTGTQIQAIPELVPFRLTPHIVAFMEPLRESGAFRNIMIAVLRCLRKHYDVLLATMDVFIREPSLDWLEHASKSDNSSEISDSIEWYPIQKIDQAKRKLKGASSTEIMVEELRAGQKIAQYTDALIRHVRGSAEHNLRARMNTGQFLTVEQQVDCLIDHAVDFNLLGRMFVGWYPWV